nr:zinc finger, CCHC-type [Tanacetum cinerariifolium]
MGDANPIRTLGDYSKPSHEGYRNTIELPVGNDVVPLRPDTIRLVQKDAHSTDFGRINLRRTSVTGFPAQSIGSSNTIALDSPNLLVLNTEASQSRQHVDTSLIHIESYKPPTAELFDVDSGRISIRHYNTLEEHGLLSPLLLVRDVSEGEACPTDSGFIADQDRATIAKSSTLPHDSAPRATSPAADEGSMQHNISELTSLCTSMQRVKVLEDEEDVAAIL